MLNSSNHPPQQQYRLHPLRQLIYSHPLAFCSSLWVVLVIGGTLATFGLFNPGPIEQEAAKPTPALTTFEESTPKQNLPLSLFGLILGCAAGSLIVTQTLKYVTRRPPSEKLKCRTTVRKKRRLPAKQHPTGSSTASKTPQPVDLALTIKPPDSQIATINTQLTQVTVLPPEESHPLDGGNENLADVLDLRRRHSLASLMHGK